MGTSSYGVECPPIGALHVSRVQTQVCSARLGSRGTTMAMLLVGVCLTTSTSSLTMAAVIDLASTASPYSGATAGNADDTNVYYTAGQNQTKTTTHLWNPNPEPRPRPSRILLVYEPLSNSNIKDAANLWVSNQPSAIATYGAVDTWDLSQVTSLENLWCGYDVGCSKEYLEMQSFNGDLRWDVSKVTNMQSTFCYARAFNGDISGWDVSEVISMYESKSMHIFENDLT
jgi:hypothetical protein